jgi:hypothetical protein
MLMGLLLSFSAVVSWEWLSCPMSLPLAPPHGRDYLCVISRMSSTYYPSLVHSGCAIDTLIVHCWNIIFLSCIEVKVHHVVQWGHRNQTAELKLGQCLIPVGRFGGLCQTRHS